MADKLIVELEAAELWQDEYYNYYIKLISMTDILDLNWLEDVVKEARKAIEELD